MDSSGKITGVPSTAGDYSVTFHATNSAGTGSETQTVTVEPVPPPPVVAQIPDQDTWMNPGSQPIGSTFWLLVNASNYPTSMSATGAPVSLSFSPNSSPNGFFWSYGANRGGKYTVTITASNESGTSAPMTFHWNVHPGLWTALVPSGGTRGQFHAGDLITLTVQFTRPVVVTGTPYVQLWGSKRANYASGSGTDTLTFTYQATADDVGQSVKPYSITLGDGTIETVDGVASSLDVPRTDGYDSAIGFGVVADDVPTMTVPHFGPGTFVVGQSTSASISASGATSYSANGLPPGLTMLSNGNITGIPTIAGDYAVTFYALNSAGSSSVQQTITVEPVPTNPPAPPPPPPQPPANNPPPTSTKSDQTITFSSPTGALVIGHAITLGATSSAGLPITYSVVSGDATIAGNTLTPTSTASLIVRASSAGSATVNAASVDVNFGSPQKAAQQVTVSVPSPNVAAEQPLTLSATSTAGLPITYTVMSGPATINGSTVTFTGTGNVTIRASQAGNGTYAPADTTMTLTAHPVTRLVNVSSRVHLASAGDSAIAGFVVTGTVAKKLLIRAVGPSLSAFGVSDPLPNPTLTVYDRTSTVLATNSGWANDTQISAAGDAVGAFQLAAGRNDAAVILTLAPGPYTAQVSGSSTGTALLEVYDLGAQDAVPTKQLINVSTRGRIDASNPLVVGFVVSGDQPKRVLIRAVGPTLSQFAVSDAVADPAFKVYAGSEVIAENNDWGSPQPLPLVQTPAISADVAAASSTVGAFALPSGSKDAATLLTLAPGAYTVVAEGAAASAGTVVVEAYEVP